MNKLLLDGRASIYSGILFPILAIALIFSSCKVPQSAYYFKTLKKDTLLQSSVGRAEELKIKKNDLLSISISSLNKEEDIIYNAPAVSVGSGTINGISSSGYLVDADGNIQYHRLGMVHVEGMTRAALKNKIQKDLGPYLKDPIVTVRYLNHKVTVLGEVLKPQVLQMPEEQVSLLELLGTSGDVSEFARRDNILIIRETGNGKQFKRINLEDHSIFTSPWYWLQPDDVVYIEPNDLRLKQEKAANRQQNISLALSVMSIVTIVLFKFIK